MISSDRWAALSAFWVSSLAHGVGAGLGDPRPCDLLLGLREQDEGAQLVDDLRVVSHDFTMPPIPEC